MANENMRAIQTVTVGAGGAATIAFTSIPQTYTDLKIVLSARNNTTADYMYFVFNGSASTFTSRVISGFGGAGASSGSRTDAIVTASVNPSNWTADTFSNLELYIPNYTSSTNKSWSVDTVTENNSTTANMGLVAGLWSTSSAITSIEIVGTSAFVQYTSATLYGVTRYTGETGGKATGGTVTSDANYWYHTFTTSGIFTPTQSLSNVDYLVVAGGGGSGYQISGGGGAGGVRCTVDATGGGGSLPAKVSFTNGTPYTILVGGGGAVGTSGRGSNGTSSSIVGSGFSTISCTGGGGSGWYDSADAAFSGGSGGGGAATAGGSTRTGGAGTANEGYAGGNGTNIGAPPYQAGSGGGAGAAGKNSNNASGTGGNGIQTSISGTATYYGGGGGAASYNPPNGWAGGLGGGGAGNSSNDNQIGTNGTANTGGGGGGNGIPGSGNAVGSGGSGIVIIRYAK